MKKIVSFLCGFCSCFVMMLLIGSSLFSSHAEIQKYEFEKSAASVYMNGIEKKIDTYQYKENTYVKLNDLKGNLNNLNIVESKKLGIYITEKTGFGILEYKGKKYIEGGIFLKRLVLADAPYQYMSNLNAIFKTSTKKAGSAELALRVKPERSINGIGLEYGDGVYGYLQYFEYDDTKSKLIDLIKICYENEKYLKEKSKK